MCQTKTNGYPAVLQSLLGTSGWEVKNFGNSGKTMLKSGLGSSRPSRASVGPASYWSQQTWLDAQAYDADIYTIMLGTNDAKVFNWFPCTEGVTNCSWVAGDNYTADFIDMVSILHRQTAAPKVFVLSPPPLYKDGVYNMNQTVINTVLRHILPQVVHASPAQPVIIDVFEALGGQSLSQPNITCDGCHPNDDGYNEIALAIYNVLMGDRKEERV